MTIHDFTPASALAGGLLIGLAASALWLLSGRIAGVSGIVGRALEGADGRPWRVAFVAGLIAGGLVMSAITPDRFGASPSSITTLAVAGLLVGFGTTLGNGCTSGHGVCGVGRLSPRSMLATATFVGIGMVTVVVMRVALGAP